MIYDGTVAEQYKRREEHNRIYMREYARRNKEKLNEQRLDRNWLNGRRRNCTHGQDCSACPERDCIATERAI